MKMNQMVQNTSASALKPAPRPLQATCRHPCARAQDQRPRAHAAAILRVALLEFGEKGLAGARIDAIAAATDTSKRMIYYYFGSKDGLYLAALEQSYARCATASRACTSTTWTRRPPCAAW